MNMRLDLPSYLQLPPLQPLLGMKPAHIDYLRKLDKKIGFTCGAFDLLHAGHMLMMQEAKERACDFLFVGLQTDPSLDRRNKHSPSETLIERQIRLEANKYVDAYAVYSTEAELEQFLALYARSSGGFIDVRILDEEYKDKAYTGRGLPIDVYYNWRDHPFSTTTLRKRVAEAEQLVAA